jgi:hypothetical protein
MHHMRGVGAFADEPSGFRLDAGLLKQRRQLDASPFGAGDQPVQGLDIRLERLW